MAKFCQYCGAPLEENTCFCPKCGANVMESQQAPGAAPSDSAPVGNGTPYGAPKNTAGITERNIALCIIFSIITCGIYGLYWLYKLNDEINQIAGEPTATGGGMVIVFTLITCGIYGWYWCYKMGERTDKINGSDSNKILFIVLAIFGLSIVNYAIMQDVINKQIA